ncbi:hypothetical protein DJ021_14125 [Phenylobacterium hankyongense]|uniref:Terminase small subunit n=1 Tax=Phenylobacterium hankyongense TaxID=1813876 RepID=A0A328B4M3_9CAUL|nr:hypothetical protein [Phenylobacterium hankyongense]RAK60866.1 hypothetical protein DJ021_14125 [Phenylobacterium hankyongense]
MPAKKQPDANGVRTLIRYSPEVAQEICERLAQGEVWFRICNTGRMPSYGTLYQWRAKHPEFAEAYAQAKEMCADFRADKALVVAEAATAATVSADRLHVSALQWRAAKGAPHLYGAKAEANGAGGGERRLVIEVRRFERATRPDGTVYVREVLPPPEPDDDEDDFGDEVGEAGDDGLDGEIL